ncbi:MAG: hypothetical protein KJS95_09845 [Gammaproteobacteria bacterium]|nr:hypothetical protein [Gammaproteobacteria bacterium]
MATQDELLAGLLGGIPGGALTQGLLATSAGLLAAGGPSYEPRSLGGALGAGMMGGLNAYQQAQQNSLSQYVAATKLAQQMRQQEAITSLAANMDPRQRAVLLANPEAATSAMAKDFWTKTELDKKIGDYTRNLNHPDTLVRNAAIAQLAAETPEFKALVAGATAKASERGRFDAVSTGELAARAGAEAGAREAATLPFAGPRAAATAAGSFYATPQRIGDSLVMIPAPGAPALPGAPRMGAGVPSAGAGAPGAPAVPGAPAGQPGAPQTGAPSVVYSAPRDAEKTASMEDTLRKEFDARAEVKGFKEVAVAYGSAMKAADNKAGDLNIVYALAKTFDPGSVVREGESVMVVNATNLPGRVEGLLNYVAGGGQLGPSQRRELLAELNTRASQWKSLYDSAYQQTYDISGRRDLNVRNVLGDRLGLPEFNPVPSNPRQPEPATPQPRRPPAPAQAPSRPPLGDIFGGQR